MVWGKWALHHILRYDLKDTTSLCLIVSKIVNIIVRSSIKATRRRLYFQINVKLSLVQYSVKALNDNTSFLIYRDLCITFGKIIYATNKILPNIMKIWNFFNHKLSTRHSELDVVSSPKSLFHRLSKQKNNWQLLWRSPISLMSNIL